VKAVPKVWAGAEAASETTAKSAAARKEKRSQTSVFDRKNMEFP
jgi:hypothetical protein